MVLNIAPRPHHSKPQSNGSFPFAQLALLALVRVAEPIALTSIFPYAWKLVQHFNIGDSNNASFYAGLLIAAFSLAECLTGMFWGALSDRVGRKPILLCGCLGTVLSLLLVGFSTSFWMAIAGRALGGLLNGNIGVIQTMVGELVTNPEHEPKAFAVMPFVWSIGTILGPAIGGYFCNPSENFPSVFPKDGLFAQFPFLLPNLVCASILIAAVLAGVFAIRETHPDMQPWSTQEDLDNTAAQTPLLATAASTEHAPTNLANEGYGTFNAVEVESAPLNETRRNTYSRMPSSTSASDSKFLSRNVIMLIVALGLFTYHSMTYDTLLPIFLGDERTGDMTILSDRAALSGGLGMPLQKIGIVLAVNGIIALLVQGVVFPVMASLFGVWRLFFIVTVAHPLAYVIVPYLVLLPESLVMPGIFACCTIRITLSMIAYPLILILLKESSPGPSYLGKINGLAASTGAACRCIASPVGGYLYGLGIQLSFTPLAWWVSAAVAFVGALQVCFIRRRRDHATVRSLVRHVSKESLTSTKPVKDMSHQVFDTIREESISSEDSEDDERSGLLK